MISESDLCLRVELPPRLAAALSDMRSREELTRKLRDEIGFLAEALGVQGGLAAEVALGPSPQRATEISSIRVRVGSTLCRFSRQQVSRVYATTRDTAFVVATDEEIADWLLKQAGNIVRFVALLAREAVSRDPAVLLGPTQVGRIAAEVGIASPQIERLADVMREVLSLGVSVSELAALPNLVGLLNDPELTAREAAEALIPSLRPKTIDIHLAPDALRELTLSAGDEGREQFVQLRSALFNEIGLDAPDFRFKEDMTLAPNNFAFRINSVLGLPWTGLAAHEQLVNDSVQNIATIPGVKARAAANPKTGEAIAIGSFPFPSNLETWNQFEYLLLCMSTEMRNLAPRLLDETVVAGELDQLSVHFPATVRIAEQRCSHPRLVHVLRALLAEGLPIRDLRSILLALIDCDVVVTDPYYVVADDRLPARQMPDGPPSTELLVAAARAAEKRRFALKYANGTWSLSALFLDPELESEVRRRNEGNALLDDAGWCDRILDAVAAEAPAWGQRSNPTCLLTTYDLRDAIRGLIAPELPHLDVLTYRDLARECSISATKRVALG